MGAGGPHLWGPETEEQGLGSAVVLGGRRHHRALRLPTPVPDARFKQHQRAIVPASVQTSAAPLASRMVGEQRPT